MYGTHVMRRGTLLLAAGILVSTGSHSLASECIRCYEVAFEAEYTFEYAVDRPGQASRGNGGHSPICTGDDTQYGSNEHPIRFLFSDVRENEYTIEVSILDQFGAVHGHAVMLVSIDESAEFRFVTTEVEVAGRIELTAAPDPTEAP